MAEKLVVVDTIREGHETPQQAGGICILDEPGLVSVYSTVTLTSSTSEKYIFIFTVSHAVYRTYQTSTIINPMQALKLQLRFQLQDGLNCY